MVFRVSEIFYSLQGEGGRAGRPSLFIRLSGCSAKHACQASGVVCDTEYESGVDMTLSELLKAMWAAIARAVPSASLEGCYPDIVWTGGEPLDSLTEEHIVALRNAGWLYHAIETSGVKPLPDWNNLLDYVVVSPKVGEHILERHFKDKGRRGEHDVDELRYVRHAGQPGVPVPALRARHYFLSPHSDGNQINSVNLKHCVQLCLGAPQWQLSVQQHKLWRIL